MKRRYTGPFPVDLPTLGLHVEPGDTVEVPKDFTHPQFEPVSAKKEGAE